MGIEYYGDLPAYAQDEIKAFKKRQERQEYEAWKAGLVERAKMQREIEATATERKAAETKAVERKAAVEMINRVPALVQELRRLEAQGRTPQEIYDALRCFGPHGQELYRLALPDDAR